MEYDVVIVGTGIGGITAAISAAREGCRVLLIEKNKEIGGISVHSPVGLICKFWDKNKVPVVKGIHEELFPEAYEILKKDSNLVPVYDEKKLLERYKSLLSAENNINIFVNTKVVDLCIAGRTITTVSLDGQHRGIIKGKVFIDATGDGNLAAMAGAEYSIGRPEDNKTMSATLVFKLSGFDKFLLRNPDIMSWNGIRGLREELSGYFIELKNKGGTSNSRESILCFPYSDGKSLLFNSTALINVDFTNESNIKEAYAEGKKQIYELLQAITKHPAFANSNIDFIADKLGIREGRRILGDYVLTGDDCINEARFHDMVAASAYDVDIHDPDGIGKTHFGIPGSGYYHIPYRSLIAKDFDNLLLSSRCISGDFVAHSSYRVISSICGFAEACGIAASLFIKNLGDNLRNISAKEIRQVLKGKNQFVEEITE